jgi:hypothetical protein
MLGVPALIGRTFAPADDTPDGRLAVIGFGYWQKRFGEDPGVIGRPINVNGVPFRIAAVTPREFYGTSMDAAAEIMMPRDHAAGPRRPPVVRRAQAVGFRWIRFRAPAGGYGQKCGGGIDRNFPSGGGARSA